ncbi:FAD-dependent oxidoreductase [Pseudonocardia xishanensis]|uniref:ferredoxin--NADP(+) reductase n=1 Tax=Pseudonocardia xishanensis TaxID=630995 RepID=A0ABP8S499_9PSEU
MTHVIIQSCCNDAACVPVCPVDCIHPAPGEPGYATAEMLYIDPESCVDCGACVEVCPVDAIQMDTELTGPSKTYIDLNALHFADHTYPDRYAMPPGTAAVRAERGPLRVAIVGAGPAGMYAAESLSSRRDIAVQIDIFERLPTPWGLARAGIAPDHQSTKRVVEQFERTAARPGIRFVFDTLVGQNPTVEWLTDRYHAVLYSVGASADRRLGVPGEDLPGSHSAAEFVGWYNGHPDHAHHEFDLTGERAVVVGNGNVALDVARILVSGVDRLRTTDIADHALEALASSRIEEVVVVGRRGPAQASFTTPELLEIGKLPGIDALADPAQVDLDPATSAQLQGNPDALVRFKLAVVAGYATAERTPGNRAIRLRFLSSPTAVLGTDRVKGIRLAHNELVPADGGGARAVATEGWEDLACGLVLRSVGYQGGPVPGVPFDMPTATIPNVGGRVVDARTLRPITGAYTAGWIKRGPSGVVGTNKTCAAETCDAIVDDFVDGVLPDPVVPLDEVKPESGFGWAGWLAIDRFERALDAGASRPRVKVVDRKRLVELATAANLSEARTAMR